MTYDKNGNIMTLIRKGHTNSGATIFGTMDNLVYTYETNSNKLNQVLDNGDDTYGFKDSTVNDQDYWYDTNGNMTKDDNKNITAITYNHLNLPTLVTLASGNIQYFYDATGVKLEKKVTVGTAITKTFYAGNYVYEKIGTGSDVLKFFNHPEGYVDVDNGVYKYVYQYKDHLGNIRLSYKDISTTSTANFKYRKDGQIRYSQNSKQLAASPQEFSYTNYDNLGRPIESGVIENSTFSTVDPNAALPSGTKKEQQFTTYDYLSSGDLSFLSGVHSSYGNPTFLAGNVAKSSNDNTATYYSYDVYGRLKWMVQNIAGLTGAKTIDYTYDPVTGAVTKVDYQSHTPSERFTHRYTYDTVDNSLVKVETSLDNSTFTTHAEYEYYETGALKRLNIAEGLQGVDYVYNLNGQLKSINHPSLTASLDPGGDSNDLFGMMIDYNKDDFARALANIETTSFGQDQYNGNIKAIRWNNGYQSFSAGVEQAYAYHYNKNNWLTDAHFGTFETPTGTLSSEDVTSTAVTASGNTLNLEATNSITLLPGFHAQSGSTMTTELNYVNGFEGQGDDYNVTNITYDANGNIQTLKRNKNTESGSNQMDDFTYAYKTGTNQLDHVDDAVTASTNADDLKDQGTGNYIYNSIGQLIENVEEDIKYIYNASGLVTEVKKNSLTLVKFFYNDRGQRVKKESYTINGGTSSLTNTYYYVRDAAGTVLAVYNGSTVKEHTIYGGNRLGVYYRTGSTSVYQLTDHLGNVRALVGKVAGNAVINGATDYYPFGMVMPNRRLADAEGYRYAYQGQEKDPETGKEAFELRLWDGRIGRWLTVDPYGQFHSPYLGMGNNPVAVKDPDGGFACIDANGNPFPCPEGYKHYDALMSMKDAFFDADGKFTHDFDIQQLNPIFLNATNNIGNNITRSNNFDAFLFLGAKTLENVNIGKLNSTDEIILYLKNSNGKIFTGNQYTKVVRISNGAVIGGVALSGVKILGSGYDVFTAEGSEKDLALEGLYANIIIEGVSYFFPVVGVGLAAGQIMMSTEAYQNAVHDVREQRINERLKNGGFGLVKYPIDLEFRQGRQ